MIISLENISKYYGGNQVLNNVALTVEDSDRIGLIGINGCGKSTLLRIITGLEAPDAQPEPHMPQIHRNKDAAIGFLAQDSGLCAGNTIITEMRSVFRELLEAAERLEELREIMANNHDEETAHEYSQKSAYFESNDGYLIDVKINKILNGMGFPPALYERVISSLSGGERTRLALARLLLENPALLILDEPTNHLDFDTLLWLEEYLKDYKGALIIVSHDRYFLDKLITSACEIERGTLRRFKGNYTAFTAQKAEFVTRRLKEYEAQQEEIAKLEDYVARNIVRASTSNMAKSRVKKLESMERIEKPVTFEKSARLRFAYDRMPVKEVLTVEEIDLTVGNTTLIESVSFNLRKGEKLGIVGANGSGKSSLLKIIQGLMPYSRGFLRWGDYVKISYFEQANTFLNVNDTVINAVHRLYPKLTELEVRTLLGSVRLTGESVYKKVGVISGGERAKLRFAIMMQERGNVLILDEPTNHLDIDTREVLENALMEFDSTVIFVSHDRYLLNKLASRILEFTENAVHNYDGGYGEFVEAKRKRRVAEDAAEHSVPAAPKAESAAYRSKEQRANEAKKRLRIKELEAEIGSIEASITELQSAMNDPEVCADYQLYNEKHELHEEARKRLSEITDEWLALNSD
jgi:ATP-binding cassette subfamily F protein 3